MYSNNLLTKTDRAMNLQTGVNLPTEGFFSRVSFLWGVLMQEMAF